MAFVVSMRKKVAYWLAVNVKNTWKKYKKIQGIKFLEFFCFLRLNFWRKNGKIPTIIQLTEVELTTGSIRC